MADTLTLPPQLFEPELQTIADILQLLNCLDYPARVRVLNYIGARLNPDF